MPNESTRTVLVALGAGLGVALAKVGPAVFTGSPDGRQASHSLADTANDLSFSSLSVAVASVPTISIPWGTGGRPTSGR